MKRREFLQVTVAGGSALAIPGMNSCTRPEESGVSANRYKVKAFELDETTIADLQSGMESGKYTAHAIAQMYLQRIQEIDQDGPGVNSVIELNPDALAIAILPPHARSAEAHETVPGPRRRGRPRDRPPHARGPTHRLHRGAGPGRRGRWSRRARQRAGQS